MEMSQVFKLNILLGILGMQLVKIDEPQAAPATSAEKEESARYSSDEEEEDPDYVPEQRESDDSLEYRYSLYLFTLADNSNNSGLIQRPHRSPRMMIF